MSIMMTMAMTKMKTWASLPFKCCGDADVDDEIDDEDEDLGSLQRPPASPQIKRVAS